MENYPIGRMVGRDDKDGNILWLGVVVGTEFPLGSKLAIEAGPDNELIYEYDWNVFPIRFEFPPLTLVHNACGRIQGRHTRFRSE